MPHDQSSVPLARAPIPALSLAALGVVFGDIGTSPLYTFRTILDLAGAHTDPAAVLGALSLVIWTLFLITTVKYVGIAMRIDNDGEGGIVALMSLLGVKRQHRPAIVVVGLFGAALIYGDGAITPAISVLSALEGLELAAPKLEQYVAPAAIIVLLGLFMIQPLGPSRIGRAFGPIMLVWFVALAALGVSGIVRHPAVFIAIDPRYGLAYLAHHGWAGFLVLGGVFLCVTGAEALYADMGHFGRTPIRLTWSAVVFPSLLLNYAGQAALVLAGTPIGANVFYQLCPSPLLIALVILATAATIIASQAIICGAFSMTRQAIQLCWMPRLQIRQTSPERYGQIYVGAVNWTLMVVTLALVLAFHNSSSLAAAYGIAVSLTMLMTTGLLFMAMHEVLGWNFLIAASVTAVFLTVDGAFFAANVVKVTQGGYVPLLLATAVYGAMWAWHRGSSAVTARIGKVLQPIPEFMRELKQRQICRVPGTAVFLTRTTEHVPPVMAWHVRQNQVLHEQLIALHVKVLPIPWIKGKRLKATQVVPDFWRVEAQFGFMERPNIPAVLAAGELEHHRLQLSNVTYYVGHETIKRRDDGRGLPGWQELPFAFMERNQAHVSEFFQLPTDHLVEIGRQIAI